MKIFAILATFAAAKRSVSDLSDWKDFSSVRKCLDEDKALDAKFEVFSKHFSNRAPVVLTNDKGGMGYYCECLDMNGHRESICKRNCKILNRLKGSCKGEKTN
jgi:hypothetical protein